MDRRTFLRLAGLASLDGVLSQAQPRKHFDISYLWHKDLEGVMDYKDTMEEALGPDVRARLRIVKGKKNYGLIYERDDIAHAADRQRAVEVAKTHTALLAKEELTGAAIIEHKGYAPLYNISYGVGPNFEALKERFRVIHSVLGESVGKELVIEKTPTGRFALVYRRRGDLESTGRAATRHADKLRKFGLGATPIMENDNEEIYGISSMLHEEDSAARPQYVPPVAPPAAPKQAPRPGAPRAEPPKSVPRSPRISLPEIRVHGDLEKDILKQYQKLLRSGRICPHTKVAISVTDLTTGERLVAYNEDEPMQCASMVKPLVMLAYNHKVQAGQLKYTPAARQEITKMIRDSNNASTNWVMRQAGGPAAVQSILKTHYRHLFKNTSVVEYIPSGGRTYKNRASVSDYDRFLRDLHLRKLPSSNEMLRIMALPKKHGNRICDRASKVPRSSICYDKTGTTSEALGDVGFLVNKGKDGKRYAHTIIVVFEDRCPRGKKEKHLYGTGAIIGQFSNIAFEYMDDKYNLA